MIGADVELVDVVDVDRQALRAGRSVAAGRPHGDVVAGRCFSIEQGAVGDRDHAGRAIDRESSARVIVQRVGDRVVGRVGIAWPEP